MSIPCVFIHPTVNIVNLTQAYGVGNSKYHFEFHRKMLSILKASGKTEERKEGNRTFMNEKECSDSVIKENIITSGFDLYVLSECYFLVHIALSQCWLEGFTFALT